MPKGSALLLLVSVCGITAAGQSSQAPDTPVLAIQIVEGDGAINSMRLHRGHDPVVRLVTAGGRPIAGANVTFLLPATGASGSFGDSGLSLTVQTRPDGAAAGRALRPNNIAGPFRIRVTASWNGSSASATLTETNTEPDPHAGRSKKIAIAALIAGAAVGGIAAAAAQKSGSSSQASTAPAVPGSISSGTPSIGPPH